MPPTGSNEVLFCAYLKGKAGTFAVFLGGRGASPYLCGVNSIHKNKHNVNQQKPVGTGQLFIKAPLDHPGHSNSGGQYAVDRRVTGQARPAPRSSTGYASWPRKLGVTKDGISVIDRAKSHCHLPPGLLAEALSRIDLSGEEQFAKFSVPMGREVGCTDCVQTCPDDVIVYARREGRGGPTRFVMNRAGTPCATVQVVLKSTGNPLTWVLITAFIGESAEPEPWDNHATPRSASFWRSHALCWGSAPVVPLSASKPITAVVERTIVESFRRLYVDVDAKLGDFLVHRGGGEMQIYPTLWAEVDECSFTKLCVEHPDYGRHDARAFCVAGLQDNPNLVNLNYDMSILALHEDALAATR